jgi:hypothetical protein
VNPDYDPTPTKRVLVFRPGQPAAVEEMSAGDECAEGLWLSQRVGGYMNALVLDVPGLVVFSRDESRLRPNRVFPSGLVVTGTAVLAGLAGTKPDWPILTWPRRSLTDEEVARWSTLSLAERPAEVEG